MASIKLIEWLMLIATGAGPLVGIWVTRWIDRSNDKVRRREAVFEALVRTRGLELSQDHVSNLNMVPLLFKEQEVAQPYARMMEALNHPSFRSDDPAIVAGMVQLANAARRDMIRAIGKAVGTPMPEGEHERNGYAPVLWEREQSDIMRLRSGLIDVLEGARALQMIAGIFELPQPADGAASPDNAQSSHAKPGDPQRKKQDPSPARKDQSSRTR